ncbi:MAG TPA: hypothetical protein VF701_20855 [Thermoanaerobaculia bacterium]
MRSCSLEQRTWRGGEASLSSVIEESLRRLATEETDFVSRWRGKFKEVETDDSRMTYLKEKYLADPD